MWDWIKQTDPSVVIPAVIGLVGWLWHNRKNLSRANLRSTVLDAVTSKALRLLDEPLTRDQIARTLADSAWRAAGRLGVDKDKAPAWVRDIVTAMIERGMTTVDEELHKRELAKLAAGATKVVAAFTPPDKPTVPKLEIELQPIPDPEPAP